jgi:prepilin-type N-terminal cleavage/methylation domain-containing protein
MPRSASRYHFRMGSRHIANGTGVASTALRPMRPSPKASAGFTLVELLISLVIIGIISGAIAPSLSEVLSDNRQISATHDIVRLARRARSLALSTGVAHLLRYQNTGAPGSNGLGMLELFAGMNGHCTQTPWDQTFTPTAGAGQGRVEALDMAAYNPTGSTYDAAAGTWLGSPPTAADTGRPVIRLQAAAGANALNALQVCYQPNGQTYTSFTVTTNPALQPQAQDITLTISRSVNTAPRGQNRVLVLRPGASARVR